jgi:hypothetical protein
MVTEAAGSVTPGSCWGVGGYLCLQIPTTIESVSGLWKSIGSWILEAAMQPIKLKSLIGVPLIVSSLAASSGLEKREFDVFDYVDPLIGTINGGTLECLHTQLSELTVNQVTCFPVQHCPLVCMARALRGYEYC